jgi:hypothetical protein
MISPSAGILEQSMVARNRVGIGLSYRPQDYIGVGGIDSLQSIPGLLKSLKIPALDSVFFFTTQLLGAVQNKQKHLTEYQKDCLRFG